MRASPSSGIAPIAVAALLVPLRDDLVSTNLALILVIFVVLGGVGAGRLGGALAAVTAALSFDFFLTKPYLSLSIDKADDFETTILLLIVGLIVGQIAVRSQLHREAAARGRSEISRLSRVADLVARGEDPADVLLAAQAELTDTPRARVVPLRSRADRRAARLASSARAPSPASASGASPVTTSRCPRVASSCPC